MKVWQIDKKEVIPICETCYKFFKDKDIFKYIGHNHYIGFHDEKEYRSCWKDQDFCFFCWIYESIYMAKKLEEF